MNPSVPAPQGETPFRGVSPAQSKLDEFVEPAKNESPLKVLKATKERVSEEALCRIFPGWNAK